MWPLTTTIMSIQSNAFVRKPPSCFTESLLSWWIWMRERMDSELLNTTSAIIAESNLISVRDNIQKNKTKICQEEDDLMQDIRMKAKNCKGGTKEMRVSKLRKLLPLMQRFKRYRQQNALANQQLNLLNAQLTAFENGRFQKEMTDTLRASVTAMKKVGMTENEDAVYDIVDNLQETITQQNQISESLSMSLVNSMDDASSSDEALMRELFALTGEDEEEETDLSIQPVPTPDAGAIAQYVTIIPPDKSKVTPAVMAVSEPLTPAGINAVEQSQEDGTKEQERAEYGLAYGV
jgi:hypothetical protein